MGDLPLIFILRLLAVRNFFNRFFTVFLMDFLPKFIFTLELNEQIDVTNGMEKLDERSFIGLVRKGSSMVGSFKSAVDLIEYVKKLGKIIDWEKPLWFKGKFENMNNLYKFFDLYGQETLQGLRIYEQYFRKRGVEWDFYINDKQALEGHLSEVEQFMRKD